MNPNDYVTAAEAAVMFRMSVNAFRIHIHRYGSSVRKVRLGRRKTFYARQDLLSLLTPVSN